MLKKLYAFLNQNFIQSCKRYFSKGLRIHPITLVRYCCCCCCLTSALDYITAWINISCTTIHWSLGIPENCGVTYSGFIIKSHKHIGSLIFSGLTSNAYTMRLFVFRLSYSLENSLTVNNYAKTREHSLNRESMYFIWIVVLQLGYHLYISTHVFIIVIRHGIL